MRARRLRALLAAGILLAVVVGAPAALLAAVGNPLPAALPSPEAIRLAIDSGNLSPHSLAKGLALVLWACWAYFTLTGAAAAVDAIRHRSRPSLRLPSPSTRLVAVVAGALWFSTAPLELASAAALPTAVPVHLLATAATAATAATPAPASTPTRSPTEHAPARAAAPATQAAGPRTYVVQPRDTLWGIATRTLGAGERWREIYQLNRDKVMDNGVRFADPSLIEPGWVIGCPPRRHRRSSRAPGERPSPTRRRSQLPSTAPPTRHVRPARHRASPPRMPSPPTRAHPSPLQHRPQRRRPLSTRRAPPGRARDPRSGASHSVRGHSSEGRSSRISRVDAASRLALGPATTASPPPPPD